MMMLADDDAATAADDGAPPRDGAPANRLTTPRQVMMQQQPTVSMMPQRPGPSMGGGETSTTPASPRIPPWSYAIVCHLRGSMWCCRVRCVRVWGGGGGKVW